MENIADETVHVFNANDDITLHPSKDVNHAAGNANELRLRLQVQVMEIHYTSTPLPEQRRKEGADRASHYYTHALSLSLRNSDVRESALHQFCPNQLERKGRKEFLFGSASFSAGSPCFSSIYLQFAFHVGRAGRSGIRNLFRLSLQRSSNCFPETSRPIWGRFLVGIARGGCRLRPLFSLISLFLSLCVRCLSFCDLRTNATDAAIITLFCPSPRRCSSSPVRSLLPSVARLVLVIKNSRNIAATAALTNSDRRRSVDGRFHLPKCVIARPRPKETLLERGNAHAPQIGRRRRKNARLFACSREIVLNLSLLSKFHWLL